MCKTDSLSSRQKLTQHWKATTLQLKTKNHSMLEWSVIAGAGLALSGRLRHVRTPATNMPAASGL